MTELKIIDVYVPVNPRDRLPKVETEFIYNCPPPNGCWLEKKTGVYVLTPEELEEIKQQVRRESYDAGCEHGWTIIDDSSF